MFTFPSTGIKTDRAVLFGMDDSYFPFRKNVSLHFNKPQVRKEPVLAPSSDPNAPDSIAAQFYGTVLHEGGKFRMWYVGMSLGMNPDMPPEDREWLKKRPALQRLMMGPICYAESDDGLHWVKPNLGQLKFRGSVHHNAIDLPDTLIHCPTIIKDEQDPDPNRRYKMVYQYYIHTESSRNAPTMRTATSPDGIRWTAGPRGLVREFVEHCSFYAYNGYYIVNGQSIEPYRRGEGGAPRGRQGFVHISPDFEHWLQESAESFALPEPQDPRQRGMTKIYDQVHLGTAPLVYGNVAVGLYCIWHHREPFADISGDFGLVLSDDGIRYREPVKGHVYLHAGESPATPVPGKQLQTVLCQSNGILNVGDETWIYHGRWRNAWRPEGDLTEDYYGEVALAILPRDRWGSLNVYPDQTEGSVWSVPMVLPEGKFEWRLNAEDAAGIRIELSDERFQLITEFSGSNSGFVRQDGFDSVVEWPGGELTQLSGRQVRVRVHLEKTERINPRLYAVYGVCTN